MKKFFEKGKKLYWWLIGTFAMLYLAVAFVSTLHAITFFQLANTLGLAILLGAAYEIGQAAVLFSILMSQNKNRILAWGMMFLLTALQVTANVYASFKFMVAPETATENWTFWQRAILFGVEADAETYKVIISWISGALLPLVALGMTALVADNIRMATGDIKPEEKKVEEEDEDEGRLWGRKKKNKEVEDTPQDEEKKHFEKIKEEYDRLEKARHINPEDFGINLETKTTTLKEPITVDLQPASEHELLEFVEEVEKEAPVITTGSITPPEIEVKEKLQLPDSGEALEIVPPVVSPEIPSMEEATKKFEESLVDTDPGQGTIFEAPIPFDEIKPVNRPAGWHFHKEFVDEAHNVFHLGKYFENDPSKEPTPPKSKKA